MLKKFSAIYIVMLLMFGSIILYSDSSLGASKPDAWELITNFDEFSKDDTSGSSTTIDWELSSGDDGILRGTIPNLWWVGGNEGDPLGDGYDVKVLDDISFFNSTTLRYGWWVNCQSYTQGSNMNAYFTWYNGNGDAVIKLWRLAKDGDEANCHVSYHDGTSWQTLTSGTLVGNNDNITVGWQYNYSNVIEYFVHDGSNVKLAEVSDIGFDAGYKNQTDYDVNVLEVTIDGADVGFENCWTVIREIGYIEGDLYEEEEEVDYDQDFENGNPDNKVTINIPDSRYLEDEFQPFSGLYLSGTITQVKLAVDVEQSTVVSNTLSDYELYINGINQGMPSSISSSYITWTSLNALLDNEYPLFAFACTEHSTGYADTYYWYAVGIDPEAIGKFKHHNTTASYTNNNYDGTEYASGDLLYEFTLQNFDEEEPPEGVPEDYEDLKEDAILEFDFYDTETGEKLGFYTPNFEGTEVGDYVTGEIWIKARYANFSYYTSKLDYTKNSYSSMESVVGTATIAHNSFNIVDIVGSSFGDISGEVNGDAKTFERYTVERILSDGNLISIFLTPINYVEGEMENSREWERDGLTWYLGTDKAEYVAGEQIVLKYKMPTAVQLYNKGIKSSGWFLTIHEGTLSWITRKYQWSNIINDDKTVYYSDDLVYGEYAYKYIDVNDLNPPDGVTKYGVNLFVPDNGWMHNNYFGTPKKGLYFRVTTGTFTPEGDILTIDPTEPYLGQPAEIRFTANNSGKLVYENLLDQTNISYKIAEFTKPSGVATAYVTFYDIVPYKIILYVWNGYNHTEVDSLFVWVNTSGVNYSGYNVEYMEISRDRYIAGYSYGEIAYKTLIPTAIFHILTPKGERSRYSTYLTNNESVYRFFIFQSSPIGRYNVTMIGQENFTSYFYVVYDEHNYVEFGSHTFNTEETFDVYIKHDTRVGLVFLKENDRGIYVPQGTTFYYEYGLEDGFVPIPKSDVKPTKGRWRVEMWDVNDRVPIRLLATDDCVVETFVPAETDYSVGESTVLPVLDPMVGALVGLIVTVFCLLIPFIVAKGLHLKQQLPPIIYAITGGLGMVVSVILSWFPFWILPFVLIIGVLVLIMQYIVHGKKSGD